MYKMMTPGPVMVRENVRAARSRITGNPDVDPDFYNFYRDTCRLISELLGTSNETLILGGEGILGIEASCASLTEPGDRVLVLDNGVISGFDTHENLLKTNEIYRDVYESQTSGNGDFDEGSDN